MTVKSSVKSLTWCIDGMAVFGLWTCSLSHLIGNLGGTASGWRSVLADFRVECQGVDFRSRILWQMSPSIESWQGHSGSTPGLNTGTILVALH